MHKKGVPRQKAASAPPFFDEIEPDRKVKTSRCGKLDLEPSFSGAFWCDHALRKPKSLRGRNSEIAARLRATKRGSVLVAWRQIKAGELINSYRLYRSW